jgi:hypothetical protein
VTGSQIIGPQVTNSQGIVSQMTIGSSSLGSQSLGGGIEDEDSPPRDATLGKRQPKWLQDTLTEAHGSMGNPRKIEGE